MSELSLREREQWKWIKGCEGYYQISNWGRVKTFFIGGHK